MDDLFKKTEPEPITSQDNEINNLSVIVPSKPINPQQLNLGITLEKEIEGIQMGVLSDGTPFLRGRGLSRLCGISNSVIVEIGQEWQDEPIKPRIAAIQALMRRRGEVDYAAYIEVPTKDGNIYAYTDRVCLAILEYYAFEAGDNIKTRARDNFRLLAGTALRDFIYNQLGYDPHNVIPKVWKAFLDRVSLTYNSIPAGYFGVFKEIGDMIATLGRAGIHIDSTFVPDISVGLCWSKHWTTNNFAVKYSDRIKWNHDYPDDFPQSASNPQEVWAYPEQALGDFRHWFREIYIGDGKFKAYLESKEKRGELPPSFAQLALAAYQPAQAKLAGGAK
jgi:hypothetical protein